MGFKIAKGSPPTYKIWVPLDRTAATTTLYVGQLVKCDSGSFNGVAPLAVASGAADTSQKQVVYGVVVGTNDFPQTENFVATYGQYISAVQTSAQQIAHKQMGVEGMHPKGDPLPMVEIALITPQTILEAPICNATLGVAPTVVTASAVNATAGLGMTTGSVDVATVANLCTTYCRTGANAGIYRVNKSASATTHTFDHYWPYTLAIGDTFVTVPLRQGVSFAQINSTAGYIGMCLDCAATPATNYFALDVLQLDLSKAGKEKAIFKFNACHLSIR
jgi:hypothetical protein